MSLIPALRSQRQVNLCGFQVYRVSSRVTQRNPVSNRELKVINPLPDVVVPQLSLYVQGQTLSQAVKALSIKPAGPQDPHDGRREPTPAL